MMHEVIAKRIAYWYADASNFRKALQAHLSPSRRKNKRLRRNRRSRDNGVSLFEKRINPILRPSQLPSLDAWIKCGGPYLDLIPVKRKRRAFSILNNNNSQKLSRLCVQRLK